MNDLSDCKIMVVDDTVSNIDVLVETLGENYKVIVVMDGEAALKEVGVSQPDLILLDIVMPGMTGYEVCQRLKSDPATKEIPVLFISALIEPAEKVKAFEAGGIDYIPKPLEATEVLARVKTHLVLRKMQKMLEAHISELKEKNLNLERMNDLFVDREFRIKQLKKRIEELEGKN